MPMDTPGILDTYRSAIRQCSSCKKNNRSISRTDTPSPAFSFLPHEGGGIIRGLLGNTTTGYSIHHQAYDRIGEGLEVVLEYINPENTDIVIKKALEKQTGAPQIFVQWHPKFKGDLVNEEARLIDAHLTSDNLAFFKVIVQAGDIKKKQKLLDQELLAILPPEMR